jgi:hypothetical protein
VLSNHLHSVPHRDKLACSCVVLWGRGVVCAYFYLQAYHPRILYSISDMQCFTYVRTYELVLIIKKLCDVTYKNLLAMSTHIPVMHNACVVYNTCMTVSIRTIALYVFLFNFSF